MDVEICFPSFEPIPLDFEDESPIYTHSFLQFKYVRKDGRLLRYHTRSSDLLLLNPGNDPDWR